MNSDEFPIFNSPLEFLLFIDPQWSAKGVGLYDWQIQWLEYFRPIKKVSEDGSYTLTPPSSFKPSRACLRANNGSGKSMVGIGPIALYYLYTFPITQEILTSASGSQLDRQAGRHVKALAKKANKKFKKLLGFDVFEIQYRKIVCLLNDSILDLFATDEAGKAEGWHPVEVNTQFLIFVDEAKSISEPIFEALDRCTGYTIRAEVSSPGKDEGTFYENCVGNYFEDFHVTAFDCPHIPEEDIKRTEVKYGETSPFYRSKILAEFSSVNDLVILTTETWQHYLSELDEIKHQKEVFNTAGLDLSGGGDETVLMVRNGNKLIGQAIFQIRDHYLLRQALIEQFDRYKLLPNNIYIDAGGMGAPIITELEYEGWTGVNRVFNNTRAKDFKSLKNLGIESWLEFASLITNCQIIIPQKLQSDLLIRQLTHRYYEFADDGKVYKLESKQKAKANGRPSPDRADALILCYLNYEEKRNYTGGIQAFRALADLAITKPQLTIRDRIMDAEEREISGHEAWHDNYTGSKGRVERRNTQIQQELQRLGIARNKSKVITLEKEEHEHVS